LTWATVLPAIVLLPHLGEISLTKKHANIIYLKVFKTIYAFERLD